MIWWLWLLAAAIHEPDHEMHLNICIALQKSNKAQDLENKQWIMVVKGIPVCITMTS